MIEKIEGKNAMSAAGRFVWAFSNKNTVISILSALMLIFSSPGRAEPVTAPELSTLSSALSSSDSIPTMDELRVHAATITDILEMASERVELLAATDADAPALVDAIKQELSLSRRWNRHLGGILLDVVEARRALNTREREAAKEITRLTAAAEEARLELIALKKVLKERPEEAEQNRESWSEGRRSGREAELGTDGQMASNLLIGEGLSGGSAGLETGTILETRAMLASVQATEKMLVRDVDAVRAKIIEALQTLATVSGNLPTRLRDNDTDAALSSEDITAWAASMATRLNQGPQAKRD